MVHRKLANTASIPGRVRTAARAGALGPSAWSGQGGDDEDCVFMAEPRRWTYAARVDLGSYLKIAETAQSFLSKWPVRLSFHAYGIFAVGWMCAGMASASEVSGTHTACQLKSEME